MNLVEYPGRMQAERMIFNGRDLCDLTREQYRQLRGRDMAMIFQDPMMTLNPVLRVDTQMIEAIRAHDRVSPQAARDRAVQALGVVGIPSPQESLLVYPHNLSVGLCLPIATSFALLHLPHPIIAHIPSTAVAIK